MDRIVAVNSNTYHDYSLEDALTGIADAGFRYVELTATKGWTEHVFPTMSLRELWAIKDDLLENGLQPFSLSGHTNLMDKDRIADFIANIRLAAFFGCTYIISSIGEAHLEDKAEASDEEVAKQIRDLIPYLEEYGLTLGLENHGKHATGKHLKHIVDLVDSPLVMINYDTANAVFYGHVDVEEDLAACIEKVGHIHLKDKGGAWNEWNFPAIGKGTLNFKRIFQLLDEAKNACPVSIEIEFTQAGPQDLAEVHGAVRDSAEALKALGLKL